MKLGWQPRKWLEKKVKRGGGNYPCGTVAFYGPDDRRATKAVAAIVPTPQSEATVLQRWQVEVGDARANDAILAEIALFLRHHEARSVVMVDRIIGCPHEEGTDYPSGAPCPHCAYWAGRDRWTGELESN